MIIELAPGQNTRVNIKRISHISDSDWNSISVSTPDEEGNIVIAADEENTSMLWIVIRE